MPIRAPSDGHFVPAKRDGGSAGWAKTDSTPAIQSLWSRLRAVLWDHAPAGLNVMRLIYIPRLHC
jgi:hypothetical protein